MTNDQQIRAFAFDVLGYSFLLEAFSSLGSWEDSLLIFLHLIGCSFPGFSTDSFSGVSETQSHAPDALVSSALGDQAQAQGEGPWLRHTSAWTL